MALNFILTLAGNPTERICLDNFCFLKKPKWRISNLWGWDLWASEGSHLPRLEPLRILSTGPLVHRLGFLPCGAGEINGHIFQVTLRAGCIGDAPGSCLTWTRTFLEVVRAPESSQLFFISWFPYHPCGFFMHPLQNKRKGKKQISLKSAINSSYVLFL